MCSFEPVLLGGTDAPAWDPEVDPIPPLFDPSESVGCESDSDKEGEGPGKAAIELDADPSLSLRAVVGAGLCLIVETAGE